MINIKTLYFSVLKEITQSTGEDIAMEKNQTGADLMAHLISKYPELDKYKNHIRLAINEEYQPISTVLQDQDEVALITPVSGG